MEVLAKYGSEAQKSQWLVPLMNGDIRSTFLMTEPDVASCDATNIETSIVLDGDEYVINGRKWWSSGAMDPHCEPAIVMGKTDPSTTSSATKYDFSSYEFRRIGNYEAVIGFWFMIHQEGHAEIQLHNVRVPKKI